MPPFNFTAFGKKFHSLQVENTGRTLLVNAKSRIPPVLSGGGLSGWYQLDSLHFHWGRNDSYGSEHGFGGIFFPLELHVVLTKDGLPLAEAAVLPAGIAVLAAVYQIIDHRGNREIEFLLKNAEKILYKNQFRTNSGKNWNILRFLPQNIEHYFRYTGSLTTPPCSEGVVWTVFVDPLGVSSAQLETLRKLRATAKSEFTERFISYNNRPTQPLNGRIVSVS